MFLSDTMKIKPALIICAIACAIVVIASCGPTISPAAFRSLTAGEKYYRLMMYDEAIKQFNDAVKAQPSLSAAYLGIGECLAETGRFDEAIKQYKTALDLDPKNEDIILESREHISRKAWIRKGS